MFWTEWVKYSFAKLFMKVFGDNEMWVHLTDEKSMLRALQTIKPTAFN